MSVNSLVVFFLNKVVLLIRKKKPLRKLFFSDNNKKKPLRKLGYWDNDSISLYSFYECLGAL